MKEELYIVELYEYYKNLFTEKQQKYFEDYYFDNYTLSEISENYEISRNAVSSQLLKIKEKLLEYEDKLNLYKNKEQIKKIIKPDIFNEIEKFI